MDNIKSIREFSIKWINKFNNPNISYIDLINDNMGKECSILEFIIDDGKSFYEKYGEAYNKYQYLMKIIDDIDDIDLLGNAIYSKWNYFYNSINKNMILEIKDRFWFVLILTRLSELTTEDLLYMKRTIKKIKIVSNNIYNGSYPNINDEVEEKIIINSDKVVEIYRYSYLGELLRKKVFKIERIKIDKLFNLLLNCFIDEDYKLCMDNVGSWSLEIYDIYGNTYSFNGSYIQEFGLDDIDISNYIREMLQIDDLLLFDGNYEKEDINKINVKYYREDEDYQEITESLVIDKVNQILEYNRNIDDELSVSKIYKLGYDIYNLFSTIDTLTLFDNVKKYPENIVQTNIEKPKYEIIVNYKYRPQRVVSGIFDKFGLPSDWEDFICDLRSFMQKYEYGDIFDSRMYNKVYRLEGEYIYCKVEFEYGYKKYYYMTDDDSIEVGDYVIVGVGKDNQEKMVQVVDKDYYTCDKVPFPIENTKNIIRKCNDIDFDMYDEDLY